MPRKPTKKATKRAKKPLIESLATSTVLVEPGLRPDVDLRVAKGFWYEIPEAEAPKPQTVADAWDAMKAAHDAPMWIRYQTVNPYRAAQDRADALAARLPVGTSREYVNEQAYDPTRRVVPDVHQTQEPILPLAPQWNYNNCTHRRTLGDKLGSAIAWMEHSQGIITGVCAHCPTQFDTRHEEHMELLRANPRVIRSMGRAGQYNAPGSGVGQVYGTPTAIFFYNHFAWVYGIRSWLRAKYRAAAKYIRTDF